MVKVSHLTSSLRFLCGLNSILSFNSSQFYTKPFIYMQSMCNYHLSWINTTAFFLIIVMYYYAPESRLHIKRKNTFYQSVFMDAACKANYPLIPRFTCIGVKDTVLTARLNEGHHAHRAQHTKWLDLLMIHIRLTNTWLLVVFMCM